MANGTGNELTPAQRENVLGAEQGTPTVMVDGFRQMWPEMHAERVTYQTVVRLAGAVFSALLLDEVIMNADSRVDDYISRLPDWQQAICQQVRQLVHDADPEVEETIKRSVLPYFVLQGNICALLAAKDHVNVFIYDPTVADPHGVINQGHGNATARALQVYRGDPIDRPALLEIFRAVIANNRAGGWRRIRASST
jgi:hypothetical protein